MLFIFIVSLAVHSVVAHFGRQTAKTGTRWWDICDSRDKRPDYKYLQHFYLRKRASGAVPQQKAPRVTSLRCLGTFHQYFSRGGFPYGSFGSLCSCLFTFAAAEEFVGDRFLIAGAAGDRFIWPATPVARSSPSCTGFASWLFSTWGTLAFLSAAQP